MKSLDQIIQERRSVRKYLDKPVEEEKIRFLIEAARLAPSACNAQPWRFVAVTDPALLEKVFADGMSEVVVPNKWARTAPCLIIACSDVSLFTHTLAERVQGVQFHLLDMGMALEHISLKAAELELGTCFIGWFDGPAIKKVLDLPSSWKVECIVTLGYPAEMPPSSPRKEIEQIYLLKAPPKK